MMADAISAIYIDANSAIMMKMRIVSVIGVTEDIMSIPQKHALYATGQFILLEEFVKYVLLIELIIKMRIVYAIKTILQINY